jgi:glycosyltransferase involved in cell wall biosynthesis
MSSSFIKVAMPRKILRPVSRLSAAMPESAAPQAMPHRSWVSPIRVGFVVHVMQVAGAEVLVRETIRRLGSALQPTVFCLDSVGTIGEQLRAEGVEVVCLHRRPGWDLSVSRRLAMAIRERDIEVVHAHQYGPFFYSAVAKLQLGGWRPRLILTEHGRHYPDSVSPLRRAVNRLVLDRLADRVNACCAFSARALCQVDGFAGRRIQVIENGIDSHRYSPPSDLVAARQRLGLDPSRRYLVHVARHHPVKDQPMLIRAFARIADEFADVDLLLAGDGPLRPSLEQLTADLRLVKRVHFLGIRSDIAAVLQAGSVFALTSVSEAASLTLLEAMATGLPAVVTDVGGNSEIIRDGREGLLVPRGDVEACAQALRRLFREPEQARAMGLAGRRRVEQRYRLDQTITAYQRLYWELARPDRPFFPARERIR